MNRIVVLVMLGSLAACGGSDDGASSSDTWDANPEWSRCVEKVMPWTLHSVGAAPAPQDGVSPGAALGSDTPEYRIYKRAAGRWNQMASVQGRDAAVNIALDDLQKECAAEYGPSGIPDDPCMEDPMQCAPEELCDEVPEACEGRE